MNPLYESSLCTDCQICCTPPHVHYKCSHRNCHGVFLPLSIPSNSLYTLLLSPNLHAVLTTISLVIKDNTNTAIMITKKYIILLNIPTPSLRNKKQKTGYSIPSSVLVNICGLCLYYSHTTPALLSLSNTVT